jgi:uncharacterized membrane-anchored protein
MKRRTTFQLALALLTAALATPTHARASSAVQQPPAVESEDDLDSQLDQESAEFEAESPEAAEARRKFEGIAWRDGPVTGDLGSRAKVETPEGLRFANGRDTRTLLELMQNTTDGNELGMVASPDLEWFVVFEFDESGYVDDEDKDSLDADALLRSLREGQSEANAARAARGWDTLHIDGWATPPYYDPSTNNLEWATKLRGGDGGVSINHNSRALGRRGVMVITLVTDPELYEQVLPQFRELLAGYQFKAGERYSEYTSGDRVAEFGLTALIAGGVGAVAVKSGALGKLWKFIAAGLVAVGALFKRIFGGGSSKRERKSRASGRVAAPPKDEGGADEAPSNVDPERRRRPAGDSKRPDRADDSRNAGNH